MHVFDYKSKFNVQFEQVAVNLSPYLSLSKSVCNNFFTFDVGRLCCFFKLSWYSINHSSSTMSLVRAREKSRWSSCHPGGYERSTSTKYHTLALSGVSRISWIVTFVLNANSERGSFSSCITPAYKLFASTQKHRNRIDELLYYCSWECIGY